MSVRWMAVWIATLTAFAQQVPMPTLTAPIQDQNTLEQQELMAALNEANNVPVDVIRVLEAFLKKHPETPQRQEVERVLTKAAIDSRDDQRTILYGERELAKTPDDIPVLDRVTYCLLAVGGRENAGKAAKYAQSLENIITGLPAPEGKDEGRRQEERDRALGRALLYESRARTVLGEKEQAERLASKSFTAYPAEEAAREWSETLTHLGRNQEAVARLADAFAIPDPHSNDAIRAADRRRLGEMYREKQGSEKGLGDLILAAYDHTAALLEERAARLRSLDPNSSATDTMHFTLTGLEGDKLPLTNLKGKVVVLDFWATWCVPCRAQHPMYETLKQRFANRSDITFLAIDMDDDHQLVGPFLDQQHWNRGAVYFEDGLGRLLQVTEIPTTILLDKGGRLASRMNGFVPELFVDQMTVRIQEILQKNP
jgi:thiol-disulfide isomerase/thioredoxin